MLPVLTIQALHLLTDDINIQKTSEEVLLSWNKPSPAKRLLGQEVSFLYHVMMSVVQLLPETFCACMIYTWCSIYTMVSKPVPYFLCSVRSLISVELSESDCYGSL